MTQSNVTHVSEFDVTPVDSAALALGRQERLRSEMALRDIDALVLTDAVNIRYATGTRNMQIFTSRNPASRYCFLPVSGPVVMFEFTGTAHLSEGLPTVQEVRQAQTASFVAAGDNIARAEQAWAASVSELAVERCAPGATIGLERVNAGAVLALSEMVNDGKRFTLVDAQEPVERSRAIKSSEEVQCIKESLRATERAMAALYEAIQPGQTENELWSIFHQHVIAEGADYIETRLMTAGQHTNPWFQETSDHVIEPNVLISFDTDVVGCHGYYSDFSRTFHAGPDKPTDRQRQLYQVAYEQVHHNMSIIEPGLTFRQYSERAWNLPEEFAHNRYYLSAHGCGMTGEYPYLYHDRDFGAAGYDGIIEPGMTLCVESYVGKQGDTEGVKLEQQLLVTEEGTELLSEFPFEESLLA